MNSAYAVLSSRKDDCDLIWRGLGCSWLALNFYRDNNDLEITIEDSADASAGRIPLGGLSGRE